MTGSLLPVLAITLALSGTACDRADSAIPLGTPSAPPAVHARPATLAGSQASDPAQLDHTSELGQVIGTPAPARSGHTANLLESGLVGVVGGVDDRNEPVAITGLLDPATGAWSHGPSLVVPRYAHTTTTLDGGGFLVVGGCGASPRYCTRLTPAVELLSSGEAGPAQMAPLRGPRYSHTATLLADGRLLVVGGYDPDHGPLGSVEVFDPTLGAWSEGPPLPTPRSGHTAILMLDGRVLVAGGSFRDVVPNTNVFDPATNAWLPAPTLAEARAGHAAAILPDGDVLAIGGMSATDTVATVERYRAASGAWEPAASMAFARSGHVALALGDGRVLVAGGTDNTGRPLASVELYDPATNHWELLGELRGGQSPETATLLPDGRVLFVGGLGPDGNPTAQVLVLEVPAHATPEPPQ